MSQTVRRAVAMKLDAARLDDAKAGGESARHFRSDGDKTHQGTNSSDVLDST